jgi:DNA-directed RNA polymerase sigma subunit (sigma70/sigma32)
MACVAPLSAAEEMECIEHVRAGGPMAEPAAVRLLEAHLALVVSIAQRYENPRVHILDLIQAGNMGLLGALEVLKHGTQQTFGGLATEHIERAIQKALEAPE